jgi:hypothetical protein
MEKFGSGVRDRKHLGSATLVQFVQLLMISCGRFSSKNLDESELKAPILEVILEPGDMIYMPRGTIHQVGTSVT